MAATVAKIAQAIDNSDFRRSIVLIFQAACGNRLSALRAATITTEQEQALVAITSTNPIDNQGQLIGYCSTILALNNSSANVTNERLDALMRSVDEILAPDANPNIGNHETYEQNFQGLMENNLSEVLSVVVN